jgi:uncharacterized membrane protein YGL010W
MLVVALVPHTAFAASSGCGDFSTMSGVTSGLNQIGNAFSNTYVKVGLIVGMAIAGLLLMFDGGQLPQFVKLGISALIGVGLVFAVLGWIGSQSTGGTTC